MILILVELLIKVPKDVSFGCRLKAKTGANEANFVVSDDTYNGLGKLGFQVFLCE